MSVTARTPYKSNKYVQNASAHLFAGTWRPLVRVITTLLFSSSSVVSHTFSALCLYLKFGHHPHPQSYLCAKFCFFCAYIAELARGEKSRTHSLTHSPSWFDTPGTEAHALWNESRRTKLRMCGEKQKLSDTVTVIRIASCKQYNVQMTFERGQRRMWHDGVRQTVPCLSCSDGERTIANSGEVHSCQNDSVSGGPAKTSLQWLCAMLTHCQHLCIHVYMSRHVDEFN